MATPDPKQTPRADEPQHQPESPPLRFFHMRGEYDKADEAPKPMTWWRALWLRIKGR